MTHFDVPATRTDADGARYAFTYDTELRLTGVTNPQGRTWTYTYDEAGRLTAESDFNGRTLTYTHDAAGRLVTRTNGAGESLRFTRDTAGRVVEQREGASGDITTYSYGPDRKLAHASNPSADVSLKRDPLGRIVAETVKGRTISYEYDALGRRVRRTTPSGLVSEWTYDATGRGTALRTADHTLTFSYDTAGRETERRLGDDVALLQRWSAAGRLTEQSLTVLSGAAGANRLLQHRDYAYRADGHITEIRELTSGTRRFDLDAIGRVTGVRAHGWTETYAYDAAGNPVRADSPGLGTSGEREFDGTLIRRAGNTVYEHDAQGRLVRKKRRLLNGQQRIWSYTWNSEDRLTEAVTPEGDRWCYAYDPFGRRVSKHRVAEDGSACDRTDFSWDDTRLAEQTGPTGMVSTWEFAPDTDRPVAQTDHEPTAHEGERSFLARLAEETTPGRRTRFHAVVTDVVGTPTELVTPDGHLAWQRRTSVWGAPFPAPPDDEPSVDCPLRFPGQYVDPETGLHYNVFRYFDPETGSFVSADPLGLDPYPNPYAYGPNPFTWLDPLGLACKKIPTDELNWNTRSRPTFGHTFSEHGAGAKNTKSLTDRARSTGNQQGQWLDNDKVLEFLKTHHDPNGGVREVELPPGMGQVIMPDGEIVEATYARLVPKPDGSYKTAFPIVKK
ncbi:RHS repeat-associated core domain-containing protein [Streptomyces sp. SID486]|uniref:RHS repeat-associated core domain-containing protein n=1 Tax=Streptomyces sp. SID486 TaxID=2690264 RepID=UPI0031F6A441